MLELSFRVLTSWKPCSLPDCMWRILDPRRRRTERAPTESGLDSGLVQAGS